MRTQQLTRLPLIVVAVILFGAILPSAAQKGGGSGSTSAVSDTLTRNDMRRYDYFFMEAIRKQNAGEYAAAFDLLNHCLEIQPNAAEAYYARALYHTELQNDSLALLDIEKAAMLNPENDTYQERVAQYYIGTGNYDKAIKAYENLFEHHKDRSDVLNILAQLYSRKRDFTNMLGAIERIEQIEGVSDEITLAKMNVYEQMGDKQKAEEMLRSLVEYHPYDAMYKVMYGNWLLQNKRDSEAHEMLTAALNDDPDNEEAQSSMYDYYRAAGMDSLANATRDAILMNKNTSIKTKSLMMRQFINENDTDTIAYMNPVVLNMFDRVIASDTTDATMAIMKWAYMEEIASYVDSFPRNEIENILKYIIKREPDNTFASIKLLEAYWNEKRWDDIVYRCEQSVMYNPDKVEFYYFMGLAHYQKDEKEEALNAFERGSNEINQSTDASVASDLYAVMGDLLYEKGKKKEAFAAYDNSLQWKEDNISCLNNYAYYLSLEGTDLDKAERMSYTTVNAEPNNTTYLDTYAWILFMKERYADAKEYINQALELESADSLGAVVVEHAGDIHAMCGQMDKAVEYWQQAINLGGEKSILRKKIKQRKYIKRK